MKMASRLIDLISKKNKLHVKHTFSSTPFADHLDEKDIHFREL